MHCLTFYTQASIRREVLIMRESVAIIERLHATAHLLNNAIGLNCVIVGPEKEIALEMPPNHIGSCFCKRLEELTGETEKIVVD